MPLVVTIVTFASLQNNSGLQYTSYEWSKMLQKTFQHYTGNTISINIIRSSFVTNAKDHPNSQETLDSIAEAMRHSRKYQEAVYDKRTSDRRLSAGLQFAAEQHSTGGSKRPLPLPSPSESNPKRTCKKEEGSLPPPPQEVTVVPNEVVAVVGGGSTSKDSGVIQLAKVVCVDASRGTVLLQRMVETGETTYKLAFSRFQHPIGGLVPGIDVCFSQSENCYHLRSLQEDILRAAEEL